MKRRSNNETPKRARTTSRSSSAATDGGDAGFAEPERRRRTTASPKASRTPSTAEKYLDYDRYKMSTDQQLRQRRRGPSRKVAPATALTPLDRLSSVHEASDNLSSSYSPESTVAKPQQQALLEAVPGASIAATFMAANGDLPLAQDIAQLATQLSHSSSEPLLDQLSHGVGVSCADPTSNTKSATASGSSSGSGSGSGSGGGRQYRGNSNVTGASGSGQYLQNHKQQQSVDLTLEEVSRSLGQGREQPFDLSMVSVLSYVRTAVMDSDSDGDGGGGRFCGGGAALTAEARANKKISNFFSVPLSLECLVWFGLLICLDAYLFLFTFLPLRFAVQLGAVMGTGAGAQESSSSSRKRRHSDDGGGKSSSSDHEGNNQGGPQKASGAGAASGHRSASATLLGPMDTYDMVCIVVIGIACTALQSFDMSYTYHFIRGQTMIKLYVLTSMLDVLERLLCSFGEDALSSMHFYTRLLMLQQQQLRAAATGAAGSNACGNGSSFLGWLKSLVGGGMCGTSAGGSRRSPRPLSFGRSRGRGLDGGYWTLPYMLGSMSIYVLYVVVHACFYFIKVATLTVAFNTTDQSFITILILNNFAEMKVSVFKKFDATQLFELTCADIAERFQIALFLVCMVIVALAQSPRDATVMEIMAPFVRATAYMSVAEVLSDWIKHAFINKFNKFNPSIYDNFARRLRSDMLLSSSGSIGGSPGSPGCAASGTTAGNSGGVDADNSNAAAVAGSNGRDTSTSSSSSSSSSSESSATSSPAAPVKATANSHDAMRKIGLTHIPLACVFIRYMTVASYMPRARSLFHLGSGAVQSTLAIRLLVPLQSAASAVAAHVPPELAELWTSCGAGMATTALLAALPTLKQVSTALLYTMLGLATFGVLLLLKVAIGMCLIFYCAHVHNRELEELQREADDRAQQEQQAAEAEAEPQPVRW